MGLSLITTTDILLNEILKELKEINSKLNVKSGIKRMTKEEVKPKKICDICGETHEKPWMYAQCKNKK